MELVELMPYLDFIESRLENEISATIPSNLNPTTLCDIIYNNYGKDAFIPIFNIRQWRTIDCLNEILDDKQNDMPNIYDTFYLRIKNTQLDHYITVGCPIYGVISACENDDNLNVELL